MDPYSVPDSLMDFGLSKIGVGMYKKSTVIDLYLFRKSYLVKLVQKPWYNNAETLAEFIQYMDDVYDVDLRSSSGDESDNSDYSILYTSDDD